MAADLRRGSGTAPNLPHVAASQQRDTPETGSSPSPASLATVRNQHIRPLCFAHRDVLPILTTNTKLDHESALIPDHFSFNILVAFWESVDITHSMLY